MNSNLLMVASMFSPMLHLNDHPTADRESLQLRVSLPSTIETFVEQRLPHSTRIELCHNDTQIVVHHGWTPLAEGCRPGPDDRTLSFEE